MPRAKLDTSIALTVQLKRLKPLGIFLRLDSSDIPNAALDFEKGDAWRRLPGAS